MTGVGGSQSHSSFLGAETVVVSALLVAWALVFAVRRFKRTRPDFEVGAAIAVAVGLRLLAAAGVSATGLNATLRGGDENTFMFWANALADSPLGHGFIPHGPYQLHTVLFGLEIKYGGFSEGAMRVGQVGIAMLGVLFMLAAVYDLAGPRAARLAAWILAFEPASIFFNSGLSKEPVMVLAGGLAVYGGTRIWRHLDPWGVFIVGLGALIAIGTRPYAGWFLVSAGALLILHAGLRQFHRPLRAMPFVYGVVIVAFIAAPTIIQATSEENLKRLQVSQDYSTRPEAKETSQGANENNLALERVDFSTREAVFTNLPKRMVDVVIRPYPWQIGNASQQLGAMGSLVALTGMFMLIGAFWRCRGRVMSLVGPMLYPLVFLLMAYSVSAGNAGTGFRYRTHLVMLALAMLVVLREHARERSAQRATREPASPGTHPMTVPSETGHPARVTGWHALGEGLTATTHRV